MKKNTFIIAEIGQAHEGSLGIAHSYIDALKETGVDAIKWQTHLADAESSEFEKFRVNFSYEDKTRYDYWKRMEFDINQWSGLKDHTERENMKFISSPFSIAAVDLLEKLGTEIYKIGSGELTNLLLINRLSKTRKKIILSSGLSNFDEIDEAVSFLAQRNSDCAILQCTTEYPSKPKNWGLNIIQDLQRRYDLDIGYSDHSGDIYAPLAAVSLGAKIIECHVVFHKKMFGPDSSSSLTIEQITSLVKGIRLLDESLSSPINKNEISHLVGLKELFGKSLSLRTDLKKGDLIEIEHLESKKPSNHGISSALFESVIGKKINCDLKSGEFLRKEHLDE